MSLRFRARDYRAEGEAPVDVENLVVPAGARVVATAEQVPAVVPHDVDDDVVGMRVGLSRFGFGAKAYDSELSYVCNAVLVDRDHIVLVRIGHFQPIPHDPLKRHEIKRRTKLPHRSEQLHDVPRHASDIAGNVCRGEPAQDAQVVV
eukprot:CAMPEP_0170180968 /NCGR_PEP_ID=MMETSP0040_2-20121228/23567_1 /TAXON_ID=641309 /ORGANISM="Lotharella oceanica, Strain CCMP622" /LENGTH=146 /DNA_ID=CAMNT_0010425809 /DNA_START=449 /DNA_END=889 /DNA_ORIENTATION=+